MLAKIEMTRNKDFKKKIDYLAATLKPYNILFFYFILFICLLF